MAATVTVLSLAWASILIFQPVQRKQDQSLRNPSRAGALATLVDHMRAKARDVVIERVGQSNQLCKDRTRSRTLSASGVFQKITSASSVAADENSTVPMPSRPLTPVFLKLILRTS